MVEYIWNFLILMKYADRMIGKRDVAG